MLCIPDRNWRCEGWSLRGGRHGSWWRAAVGRWVFFFWRLWLWDQHVHLEQRRIRWAWLAPSKRKLQRSPWTECRPHHTHTIWSALFLFYTFSKSFTADSAVVICPPKKLLVVLHVWKEKKKLIRQNTENRIDTVCRRGISLISDLCFNTLFLINN